MNDIDKVAQLEKALLSQAESLAREQSQNSDAACTRIKAEAETRLSQREEDEIRSAKQQAERLQNRLVQSAEARLAGELDRLRWTLVQSSLSELRVRLQPIVADQPRYVELLQSFLGDAEKQLPAGDLLVRLGRDDFEQLRDQFDLMARNAAPARNVEWKPLARPSGGGGLVVSLADESVRIDHSFAGRFQRLEQELAQTLSERLFAASQDLGSFVHG